MRSWAYTINQWNIGLRSLLLFFLLFILGTAGYFIVEKPLLENNQVTLKKLAQDQALEKELTTFVALQNNFIYKNELQKVPLKQVFQSFISGSAGLTMKSYVDNPVVALPAGAAQFARVMAALQVPLLNTIQQFSATMVFSGGFNGFVTYLQALQNSGHLIYFDSIDFNMNRYPKAEITMKVFTLGGA